MENLQVIDIEGKRASSSIRKGQRAWTAIKATAEEQRTLWLEVGVALMYGKLAENRPGQKFSEWCDETFPGIDTKNDVPAALWFASDFPNGEEIPSGISHPCRIRQWFNDQQATKALPPELLTAPPPVPTASLPKESAVKVNKLAHRAAAGDEGSAIADRMLKAFAKTHGIDLEALLEAAAVGDPEGKHRFNPQMQLSIDQWREGVQRDVTEMEQAGISREAIKHLLINLANSL